MEKKDILDQIIERKKQIIAQRKLNLDLTLLKDKIQQGRVPIVRHFRQALEKGIEEKGIAIIAEMKKASPSKGLLREDYHPNKLAKEYEKNGARCLSILTDEDYFQGCDYDLQLARINSTLPTLRKDFIIDSYQIYESRLLGADCILLIAAILNQEELLEFYSLATSLGLDVLIEVANEQELATALSTPACLIGINNRNLRDFTVNLNATIDLTKHIPKDRMVICESGIKDRTDIDHMLANNIKAFLIGEAIIKSDSPGNKLLELQQKNIPN